MRSISIVTGCYNEEGNVRELWARVTRVMAAELPEYAYEFIFIDNASEDGTVKVLKEIARDDKRVKIIVNNRNFGHIRSGYHAMLQAGGQAVIAMASDLEDPPEMIPSSFGSGGGLQDRTGAEALQRGVRTHGRGPEAVLQRCLAPFRNASGQGRNGLWPL